MAERKQTARHSRKGGVGNKAAKTLALVGAAGVGYLMGLHLIGPTYLGHAEPPPVIVPISTSTGSSHRAAPHTSAAKKPVSSDSGEPVAVITEQRPHPAAETPTDHPSANPDENSASSHERTPAVRRHKRHPSRPNPEPDIPEGVGDQTVSSEDAANVSGADLQPPGEDPSSAKPHARSHQSAAPGVGDTTDNSRDNSEDVVAGPLPVHETHSGHRSHPSSPDEPPTSPVDSNPAPAAGDSTPPPPVEGTAPTSNNHGVGSFEGQRHWTAASLDEVPSSLDV